MVEWLQPQEERAWRAYRRLVTLLESRLAHDLERDTGLSMSDYEVLSNLSESTDERWRLTRLAHRLRWSQSRLSHHVRRMEARGLVRREPCTDDGRGVDVVLTVTGRTALVVAGPHHVDSVRTHLFDRLSNGQVGQLEAIAHSIAEPLESD